MLKEICKCVTSFVFLCLGVALLLLYVILVAILTPVLLIVYLCNKEQFKEALKTEEKQTLEEEEDEDMIFK